MKLGMEAAQTTCGENERKHYSRTKSEKKKKKKVAISRQRKEACWGTKLKISIVLLLSQKSAFSQLWAISYNEC